MSDFVSFEIAKKLKEKGFSLEEAEIYGNFDSDGLFHPQLYCNYIETMDYDEIIAPTISQVLKWLRDVKDINLVISPVFFYDDILGKMREYGCKVFTPSLNKPEHCGYHEEWEQATLAGIEYVLDNLI